MWVSLCEYQTPVCKVHTDCLGLWMETKQYALLPSQGHTSLHVQGNVQTFWCWSVNWNQLRYMFNCQEVNLIEYFSPVVNEQKKKDGHA